MLKIIERVKQHRRIVSALCVGTLLAVSFAVSNAVLMRKNSYRQYAPYYESDIQYDVVLFGTSHMYDGISPLHLWKHYGIRAYNLGYDSASVANSYWSLRRAVAEGKRPKLVVVDVFENRDDQDGPAYAPATHTTMDYFGTDAEKIGAIKDLFENQSLREAQLFPFSEYHNRWKEVAKADILPEKQEQLGFHIGLTNVVPPDKKIIRDRSQKKPANEHQRNYLKQIKELCDTEGIELLLINIPYSYTPDRQMRENGVYDLAEELDAPYINYMNEETAIDFDIHFNDAGHLNLTGAHLMTDILAEEIISRGYLADAEEDTPEEAEELSALYDKYVETMKSYLKNTGNLKVYLSDLASLSGEIEVKLKWNAGNPELQEVVYQKLFAQLENMPDTELTRCGRIYDGSNAVDVRIEVYDRESGELVDSAGWTVGTAEASRRAS